jgi:hypothetical protein
MASQIQAVLMILLLSSYSATVAAVNDPAPGALIEFNSSTALNMVTVEDGHLLCGASGGWDGTGATSVAWITENSDIKGFQFKLNGMCGGLQFGIDGPPYAPVANWRMSHTMYAHSGAGPNCPFIVGECATATWDTSGGDHQTTYGEYNMNSDIMSIRINDNNYVEYLVNDDLRYTSTRLMTYPWRVTLSHNPGYTPSAELTDIRWLVNPTPPPTTAPTIPPTPAGATSSSPASAKGDPHLQNINGQRFDLMRSGRHVLLHIPKGADAPRILFRVDAEVQRLGPQCGDMYFQHINITGAWVEAKHKGILQFHAGENGGEEEPTWMSFGAVQLKVVRVNWQGIHYLNLFAKHLGRTGFTVGGLLGEDDHTHEATPDYDCIPRINLAAMESAPPSAFPASSAEASLA